MSSGKTLTQEIARQFLDDADSVDLSEFSFIEDAAAEALAQHQGWLSLNGLTSLSDAAAMALAKHEGYLSLDGLTGLSDAAAGALAKHQGFLSLDGLTGLSEAAEEALATHEGGLGLNGLSSLSDAAAAALAETKVSLSLNGLTSLSDAAAAALAKHEGDLCLDGLTSLSDAAVRALAKNQGFLSLNGLTGLSNAAAEMLAEHENSLSLNGLTSLSDAAAAALAKKKTHLSLRGLTSLLDSPSHLALAAKLANDGGSVYLDGLTSLGDAAAAVLAKTTGELNLNGLTSLSDAAAEALAEHDGDLILNGLTHLLESPGHLALAAKLARNEGDLSVDGLVSVSDEAAEALATYEGELSLWKLVSLSDRAAEALAKHEGYLDLSSLPSLSEAAAEALARHSGYLCLSDEVKAAVEEARERLGLGQESADQNEEEENDGDDEPGDKEKAAALTPEERRMIDLLARKAAALVVAQDAQATGEEQDWLEKHWGEGAHLQIIHLASSVTVDGLKDEIREFLDAGAHRGAPLRAWLEELQPLEAMDSGEGSEILNGLLEHVDECAPPDGEESGPGPEARRLRAALSGSDVDAARTLIEELDQNQISEAICGQGVMDSLGFLSSSVEDKLSQLNSPQFILRGKPAVVSLAEVVAKCGPLHGPVSTFSFGPRPTGWGMAAKENRILSWNDEGFGQVGDQVVNIGDRFVVARPLDAFNGALIVGSLEDVEVEDLPESMSVMMWNGRRLTMEPFDPGLFREVFHAATRAEFNLEWSYDFRGLAAAREAIRFFMQHDEADRHADILLARATLSPNEDHREMVRQALKLDPSLKAWADWIEAWIDFPENMDRTAGLKDTDPMGPALLAAMQTRVDLEAGKTVSLDALEAYAGLRDNAASPYLSRIFGRVIDMCVEKHLEEKKSIKEGGDPGMYAQAIRLGYRDKTSVGWLLAAIRSEDANEFVRFCLKSGFNPVGRFLNGIYLNVLASAADAHNVEAVQALLEHGADPKEPSHLGGSTLELAQQAEELELDWPEEILAALQR